MISADNTAALTENFSAGYSEIVIAWIVSTAVFAWLIIYLSKHPQKRTAPIMSVFVAMFILGTLMYCQLHYLEIESVTAGDIRNPAVSWMTGDNASWYYMPYVIMSSVMDVGMMFYGRVNSSVFYNLPISESPLAVFIFWLINLVSFYTVASALLLRFGNDLLRWIRSMTSKISDVDLIFGVNDDSVVFGRNISGRKGSILVYADSVTGENYESSIRDQGGISYTDKDAMKPSESFLKRIRIKPGATKLRLYALSHDYDRNLQYARIMSETLQKAGIFPGQTELVLLGTEEWKGMYFQSGANQYGYGSVTSFDEYEMSARLLIHEYPLCESVRFDENGRACEDINVLIVGFGRIGHEVLRKVIANGQFEGSNFHATIYDPNFEHREGFVKSQYPGMFTNYNIDFEPQSGRGTKIFSFLKDNASTLKYIVVCIDDRDTARDIAVHMADRLQAMGYPLNVYTCDTRGIRCYSQYAKECATHWIYDSELLYSGELDRYAMELNHRYAGGSSVSEDWKNCDYFGRMSSRASVDYLMPLIRRVTAGANSLTEIQRENLAKSEHLRWCAFHYTFGYDVMDTEEFSQRVKARQDEIRGQGHSSIKITKDAETRRHVCLVDWDGLDEISRIENEITNGSRNYKDSDRKNVDMVMEILQGRNTNYGK